MYREIVELASKIADGTRLDERLTPEQMAQERAELATPDVRPCTFDRTFEAWIARLTLWGKVHIYHSEPEYRIRRKEITHAKFFDSMANDSNMIRAFGKWENERTDFNKVRMWRDYVGLDGKRYTEEYFVEVDMRPDAFTK